MRVGMGDAARELGVHPETLRRHIAAGVVHTRLKARLCARLEGAQRHYEAGR